MMNTSWTYTGLVLKTTDEYGLLPSRWGEGTKKIVWIGNDAARVTAMAAAESAFDGLAWGSGVPWSTQFKDTYTKVLRTFFSLPALRALMTVHDASGEHKETEKEEVISVCVAKEFPLCTPMYLMVYLDEVRKVASGASAGGAIFTMPDVATEEPVVSTAVAELAELKEQNRTLLEQIKNKPVSTQVRARARNDQ